MSGHVVLGSADNYHADSLVEQPTLSASVAQILCTSSPRHAWTEHPRLNPDYERKTEDRFELGTACHAVILEGRDIVEPIAMPDWRTNAAKELRDAARADGRIPLLVSQWQDVQKMFAAAQEQIAVLDVQPVPFTGGKPEQALVWEEDGVWCRALIDWLHDDHATISDYKTTTASAHPDKWVRTALGFGADVQVAFHMRGVRAVFDTEPVWRYVVQETYPPFALSVVDPDPVMLAIGDSKVDHALKVWRRCLETDKWDAYPTRVCTMETPAWAETQWLQRIGMEAA